MIRPGAASGSLDESTQASDHAAAKFRAVHTPSRQFRWLAQPRLHGLFVGEVLVFLLFKGKLIKHANHRN